MFDFKIILQAMLLRRFSIIVFSFVPLVLFFVGHAVELCKSGFFHCAITSTLHFILFLFLFYFVLTCLVFFVLF